MKHFLFSLLAILCCCTFDISAQSLKPADLVKESSDFQKVELFTITNERSSQITDDIKEYTLVNINEQGIKNILQKKTTSLSLSVPTANSKNLELKLVEVDVLPEATYATAAPSGEQVKVNAGKHYRGVVTDIAGSTVAVSIFDGEVMGLITTPASGNLVLGKLKNSTEHIIYEDDQIKDKITFECGTPDSGVGYTAEEIKHEHGGERALSDCVRLYFEVDYDIFQDKGGISGTTSYVTGLFNQVATMYANENINVVMSPLVIWTEPSPYNGGSSLDMLNAFTGYRQGFDGDLAMLLSYKSSGGIAYVNGLCSSNPDFSMSFSSINSTYADVPTYSWSVMVVTHEFGHLFGSQHTHACVWNGNNTAIDGCYTTEGGCPDVGNPSGGGTVMSYCHLTNVGINLNLGFGPQPGNVIRGSVSSANCTAACDGGGGPTCTDGIQNGAETGVDCGGPDCPACPTACTENEVAFTLVLDNYPTETDWTITDSNGATLYSGGGYTVANSTVTQTFCLPDGCFDFNITDTYGDGICCSYGQGSYDLSDASGTLISGGQFGNSETQNFCQGGGNQPTCTDGVQNGSETGVDCGGPDCPACPTCTDGIQNGNETGVDCGGSDCSTCPTCTDGVQNGSETGIDCGGPDCAACPTCTDGVQNGDETGVDCGGSCSPCDTGGGCTANTVNINITLDNYPGETTWQITDAAGAVVAAGGPFGDQPAGSSVSEVACLGDACFTFTIFDSYGDGICCSYGNGNYSVTSEGVSLASGGQFTTDEATDFCLGGSEPTPTCDDGLQNGNETGVDCGGPDCAPCNTGGGDQLFAHYFETGWDGWQDGGSDCYRYTGTRSYEGNFSIRLRDNSGTASAMTSPTYNTTGLSGVEVSFYFYPNSMETGEDFSLQYFDGSTWQVVANFVSGSSFQNNQFYTAVVPILSTDYTMSSAAQFRFQCDASSNADRVYIDAVVATGLGGSNLLSNEVKIIQLGGTMIEREVLADGHSIHPNPAQSVTFLDIEADVNYASKVRVMDMLGREMYNNTHRLVSGVNTIELAIDEYSTGAYMITYTDEEEEIVSLKFIKIK